MESRIFLYRKIKLKNPVLIQGLPGIGNIGRLAVSYLASELNAEKIGELISPHMPSIALVNLDSSIEPMVIEFFLYKTKKRDIIFVTGEAQPVSEYGQYECSNRIIEFCENFNINEIVTIGGYGIGEQKKNPLVYGIYTSEEIVKKFEDKGVVFQKDNTIGSIIGMNGLVLALAKLKDLEGICLLAETMGYPLITDPQAAEIIIKILKDVYEFEVDLDKLEQAVKDMNKLWSQLQEQLRQQEQKAKEQGYSSYIC